MDIGTLRAIFDADTSKYEAGVKRVQSGTESAEGAMHKFTSSLKEIGAASVVLEGPFGGVSSRLRGLSTLANELGGSFGVAGLGIAGLGAGILGASGLIFELTKHTAEAGESMFHLHETTNFAVETLSALKNAAELSGGSIEGLTMGLGVFDKNVEKVNQGNKQLGAVFRTLKIDVSDNESALRSAFRALDNVKNGSQQTALAMEIFGRSGKEVVAVLKNMNGDIDGAVAKFKSAGTLMSGESAEAAHKFAEKLKELEQQFAAVSRTVGERFMPMVSDALEKVSAALDANKAHARSWADDVVSIFGFAATQIGYILDGLSTVITGFEKTFGKGALFSPGNLGPRFTAEIPEARLRAAAGLSPAGNLSTPGQRFNEEGEFAVPFGRPALEKAAGRLNISGVGGGRHSGGDLAAEFKKLAELNMKALLDTLKSEEEGVERSYEKRKIIISTYQRAAIKLEDVHHQTVLDGLKSEEEAALRIPNARKQEIALKEVEVKKIEEANRHRKVEWELEDKILSKTRERIASVDTLLQYTTRQRVVLVDTLQMLNAVRERVVGGDILKDLGGGSVLFRSEAGRARLATVEATVMHERMAMIRDQMQRLSGDLTNLWAQSVGDGFNKGVKSGLQTLSTGLLQVVENSFLKRLETGLADLLTGFASGSGFWAKLFNSIFGVVGGAALGGIGGGGGSAGAIAHVGTATGHAAGGYIEPGTWGVVGEKGSEMVYAGRSGLSVTPHGGPTIIHHHHTTIQMPPNTKGSYTSPKSQRQIAEQIASAIQSRLT